MISFWFVIAVQYPILKKYTFDSVFDREVHHAYSQKNKYSSSAHTVASRNRIVYSKEQHVYGGCGVCDRHVGLEQSTGTVAFARPTVLFGGTEKKRVGYVHGRHDAGVERSKTLDIQTPSSIAEIFNFYDAPRRWACFTIDLRDLQDFENEPGLKDMTIEFLEDILLSPNLLPAEHKIAGQLIRLLTMDETKKTNVDLNQLLIPSQVLDN